jgi:hypothetical protein
VIAAGDVRTDRLQGAAAQDALPGIDVMTYGYREETFNNVVRDGRRQFCIASAEGLRHPLHHLLRW